MPGKTPEEEIELIKELRKNSKKISPGWLLTWAFPDRQFLFMFKEK